MQSTDTDIAYICEDNRYFIENETDEPVNKQEILSNLNSKLKNFNVIDKDFILLSMVFVFLWSVILLIVVALIVEFASMGRVIIDNRVFLEEFPPLYLIYGGISLTVLLCAGYYFMKPLLLITYSLVMYPFYHSSAENLYKHMLKTGKITTGFISEVKADGEGYVVSYSFVRKKLAVSDTFVTRRSVELKEHDKIQIASTQKFSFPL